MKMATKKKKRFPKKELNTWLKANPIWDHAQWSALLDDLKTQGFEEWTDAEEGRNEIGLYLETKKK